MPRIALERCSAAVTELCSGLADVDLVSELEPVDAVLLELRRGDDVEAALAAVRDRTAAPVVLLGDASTGLLEWAADAGVADVVAAPYDPGRLLFAVQKAMHATRARSVDGPKVITVFSPKGGSGKTVVSVNLASALARRGTRRTLLVDLDLQFGDAAIMLDVEPVRTLLDVADARALATAPVTHASGLDVLPAPLRPEEGELVAAELVRDVLAAARDRYDVVVVDTSPFFHESTLLALDATDELLVVSTPEITTVKNVRLALETLERLAVDARVRVVLNRAGESSALSVADVAAALGREVDFVLPFDAAVPLGVNHGRPPALVGHTRFGAAIAALERGLFPEDWPPVPARRRPLLRRRYAFARS
jgi:pilus assembly protein CpaE